MMAEKNTDGSDNGCQSTLDNEVEWKAIVHRSFEPEEDVDIVMEIVEAVAAAEGVETTSLGTSLFSVVNITAIRAVFFDQTVLGQQRYCTGQIHFQYRGFRVTISGDGLVTVAEPVCRDRPR